MQSGTFVVPDLLLIVINKRIFPATAWFCRFTGRLVKMVILVASACHTVVRGSPQDCRLTLSRSAGMTFRRMLSDV